MTENHPDMVCYPAKTYMYWLLDEYKKLFRNRTDKSRRKELFKRYCILYKRRIPLKVDKFYHYFRFAPNLYCVIKK